MKSSWIQTIFPGKMIEEVSKRKKRKIAQRIGIVEEGEERVIDKEGRKRCGINTCAVEKIQAYLNIIGDQSDSCGNFGKTGISQEC